jgi:hypothetical protein
MVSSAASENAQSASSGVQASQAQEETPPSSSKSSSTSLHGHKDEGALQWVQSLEFQAMRACRTDERLKPLLRWNVSYGGADSQIFARLGQVRKFLFGKATSELCISSCRKVLAQVF